jgi:hypothetical protein
MTRKSPLAAKRGQQLVLLAVVATAGMLPMMSSARAQSGTSHFRPQGPGSGMLGSGSAGYSGPYTWNSSLANWYSESTGGTAQAWTNGHVANFVVDGASLAEVAVAESFSLAGMSQSGSQASGSAGKYIIRSADPLTPVTLTLAAGSELRLGGSSNRRAEFQDIALAGDAAVPANRDVVFGPGSSLSGTVTVGGRLGVRGNQPLSVILDGGLLYTAEGSGTISRLSGTGSISRFVAPTATLTLNQSVNTSLVGTVLGNDFYFTKQGSGTFIVDNPNVGGSQGSDRGRILVQGGGLYMNEGVVLSRGPSLTVSAGALFGGTPNVTNNTDNGTILSAATSILSPGMATLDVNGNVVNRAGTMILSSSNGFFASNGGTFNFRMDDDDGFGGLVNSQLVLTGGSITIGGSKTVNLFGLNAGLIDTGVPYTLIDVTGVAGKVTGWDTNWAIGSNTTGYDVQSFGWNGNQLQVILVPEPTAIVLVAVGGAGWLVWARRMPRRRRSRHA